MYVILSVAIELHYQTNKACVVLYSRRKAQSVVLRRQSAQTGTKLESSRTGLKSRNWYRDWGQSQATSRSKGPIEWFKVYLRSETTLRWGQLFIFIFRQGVDIRIASTLCRNCENENVWDCFPQHHSEQRVQTKRGLWNGSNILRWGLGGDQVWPEQDGWLGCKSKTWPKVD